jgi:predicted transcriptional regulator
VAKTVTVRMDDSAYKRIKSAAEAQRRTISNFMEYATLSYVEDRSLVDADEMKNISDDKDLLATLSSAMDDIKRGKYRIVG